MKMLFINILSILVMIFSGCKSNEAENEIYIIPYGYTGRIVIFYSQTNGSPKKYNKDERVLEIANNGILKTQFAPNYGVMKDTKNNQKFLYRDTEGKLFPIQNRHNTTVDSNEVQIYAIRHGKSYPIVESKTIIDGVERTVTKTTTHYIPYTEFIVDKFTERTKYDFKTNSEELKYWEEVKTKAEIK